jgi:deoxycytidylate deaminase
MKQMSLIEAFLEDPRTIRLRQSDKTSFHVAVLRKRKTTLAIASNKVGSRSKGSGYSRYTIHAEKNVIKALGNIRELDGCDMLVMKINIHKSGLKFFACSKPCHDCHKFLVKCQEQYGLKNVFYTS